MRRVLKFQRNFMKGTHKKLSVWTDRHNVGNYAFPIRCLNCNFMAFYNFIRCPLCSFGKSKNSKDTFVLSAE